MTDFWTSLYQPSARWTGGTPVGILRRAVRTASRCLGDWVNAQQGVGMQKHHERRVGPTPVGYLLCADYFRRLRLPTIMPISSVPDPRRG